NKINKSVAYHVKEDPQMYIKYSFYINRKIEELGKKTYQVIPQRNNLIPKHIILNSNAIIEIINDKNKSFFHFKKSKLLNNIKKHQSHIWSRILKLEKNQIFKNNKENKKYVFYNQIITDGFSCSLLFILKEYKNKEFGDKIPKINEEIEFSKLE